MRVEIIRLIELVLAFAFWTDIVKSAAQVEAGEEASLSRSEIKPQWSLFGGHRMLTPGHEPTSSINWTKLSPTPEDVLPTWILFSLEITGLVEGSVVSFSEYSNRDPYTFSDLTETMLGIFQPYLLVDTVLWSDADTFDYDFDFGYEDVNCPSFNCSSKDFCRGFNDALFTIIARRPDPPEQWARNQGFFFSSDIENIYGKAPLQPVFLQCAVQLVRTGGRLDYITESCYPSGYQTPNTLIPRDWEIAHVSENLRVFQDGGVDDRGVRWPGIPRTEYDNRSLVQNLGNQMLAISNYRCDLRSACTVPLRCNEVGSHTALGLTGKIWPSAWGYLALLSIQNLNQQLSNQYNSIDSGAIRAILDTFNIGDYFPKKDQKVDLRNALSNLGTFFSIASGVVPSIGTALSLGGTILPAFGSFYANQLANQNSIDLGQKLFAPQVKAAYEVLLNAVYNATNAIFRDEPVNGVTLLNLIDNGVFLDASTLQALPDIGELMAREILSHSLNGLWKTSPSNKMWVLFVDLRGTNIDCNTYEAGPPDSRYCAQEGVYFTYNFVERGDHKAVVDYPWGGRNITNLGLNMSWITEASAETYQLAKSANLDRFNATGLNLTTAFLDPAYLNKTLPKDSPNFLFDQAGRYPGSWTLPVCDAGTWGMRWNWNYQKNDYWNLKDFSTYDDLSLRQTETHPPCLCGPQGRETAAFVEAAGLKGFDTFYERCKRELRSDEFTWPPDVTSVYFGFGDPIQKP